MWKCIMPQGRPKSLTHLFCTGRFMGHMMRLHVWTGQATQSKSSFYIHPTLAAKKLKWYKYLFNQHHI